jgi:hypothetical protein
MMSKRTITAASVSGAHGFTLASGQFSGQTQEHENFCSGVFLVINISSSLAIHEPPLSPPR